mmetsp:Transcript_32293/g.96406  ORF Transcript_32293/g.96406 Transcript_32293/m.96406 type:complete len:270 (+) Transcript_32293:1582-2391(+)
MEGQAAEQAGSQCGAAAQRSTQQPCCARGPAKACGIVPRGAHSAAGRACRAGGAGGGAARAKGVRVCGAAHPFGKQGCGAWRVRRRHPVRSDGRHRSPRACPGGGGGHSGRQPRCTLLPPDRSACRRRRAAAGSFQGVLVGRAAGRAAAGGAAKGAARAPGDQGAPPRRGDDGAAALAGRARAALRGGGQPGASVRAWAAEGAGGGGGGGRHQLSAGAAESCVGRSLPQSVTQQAPRGGHQRVGRAAHVQHGADAQHAYQAADVAMASS